MARSRNIKPGLWLNEELAEISIAARYLFPGLWCLADKDGRLEYRPKKIKAEIYPYDDIDIISLVAELHGKKFISVYENEGQLYIQINNFKKHQNPHPKEKACGYPEPVNMCNYDGNLKQFIFTASNVQIPDSLLSFPSDSPLPIKANNNTRTRQEENFRQCFDKMETEILRLYPHADYEPQKETCIAHYREGPSVGADPYPTILKWFNRIPKNGAINGKGTTGSASQFGTKKGFFEANGPEADWLGTGN